MPSTADLPSQSLASFDNDDDDDDDDRSDTDFDDVIPNIPTANSSMFTVEQVRDELINRRQEMVDLKTRQLQDFLSEQQPDDETRHQMALLKMEPKKCWTESDLAQEFHMKVGLQLLYNAINNQSELHFERSIHIRYHTFPKDIMMTMKANIRATTPNLKAARMKAL